jgi:hypothetical protein
MAGSFRNGARHEKIGSPLLSERSDVARQSVKPWFIADVWGTSSMAVLNHYIFVYDLNLRMLWSSNGTDVLSHLRASLTYLLDNNVSWKQLAPRRRDMNFVLGCTLAEEAENLEGVFYSRMPIGGHPNVFAIDMSPKARPLVVFHRLDEDMKVRLPIAIPALSQTSPDHQADRHLAADSLRTQVQQFLKVDNAVLKTKLSVSLPVCRGDYLTSGLVAAMAMALYLQSLPKNAAKSKLDPNYTNFPGDTRLIAESLYYGFSILSTDIRDVHAMARLVSVAAVDPANLPT